MPTKSFAAFVWGNNSGTGETRGRSLLKKLRKTFIRGMGMDLVCASPCASQYERSVPYVDRSRAAAGASAFYGERLRSLVRGASSLLRGAIAGYRFICNGSKPYHIGNGTIFTGFLSVIRCIGDTIAVSANSMNAHCKTYRSRRNKQPLPPIMKNVRP